MTDTLWKPTDEPDIIAAEHIIASAHYKSKDWTDVYLVPVAQYHALAARAQELERDNRTYIDERHELLTKNEALIQQLAEAQGMVLEVGELNVKLRDAEQQVARLRKALATLLNRYISLVDSGDAGSWDPLTEPQVGEAIDALRETGALKGA